MKAIIKKVLNTLGLTGVNAEHGQQEIQTAMHTTAQNQGNGGNVSSTIGGGGSSSSFTFATKAPRTVVAITRNPQPSYSAMVPNWTIQYDTGELEVINPGINYTPQVGYVEHLDLFGRRDGWLDNQGTFYPDYQQGVVSTHTWPLNPPNVPYVKPMFTCSKCKEEHSESDLAERWNWGRDHKTERSICYSCHCKVMDKYYDLDRNVDTEKILYGNKAKQPVD